MVTYSIQGSRNHIWGAEMKGNISNVRFTSPEMKGNISNILPPSQNLTANHHVVKDPTTNDMDFESLCLFPDVKVPQNSEIPNFTKYGGDGDPLAHVKIFYNELGAHGKDERLRMCLFQRSLCGDALRWFIHLNRLELQSWNGFIRAFLDRFQLGDESILDRIDLIDIKRRQHENFGKYARRWRNVALLGLVNHHFSKVVEQGEILEQRIKSGKFTDISVPKVLSKEETKGKEKKDRGHATDNCHALRHEIQDLIDNGEFIPLIDVEQSNDPRKTTINEESKPVPEMVSREEFLRLEGQLENLQLVNEILWDRIQALEEKMAELTSRKQSNMSIFGHSTSEEIPTPAQSQCVTTNVTHQTKKRTEDP
ncbi:hypothetical protein ACH5RR_012957 [Cinchona calisaya]|uniref:Retrotransposon gag domain-containing protein n=1 Tax=Cinchona calisaya TaxID=153742 RepID=A0ABD2ZYP4_9GENT